MYKIRNNSRKFPINLIIFIKGANIFLNPVTYSHAYFINFLIFVDSVASALHSTVDATKNVATSAAGTVKGTSKWAYFLFELLSFANKRFFTLNFIVDTAESTLDTTKNVAASVVDKGSSLIGGAKGIFHLFKWFHILSSSL